MIALLSTLEGAVTFPQNMVFWQIAKLQDMYPFFDEFPDFVAAEDDMPKKGETIVSYNTVYEGMRISSAIYSIKRFLDGLRDWRVDNPMVYDKNASRAKWPIIDCIESGKTDVFKLSFSYEDNGQLYPFERLIIVRSSVPYLDGAFIKHAAQLCEKKVKTDAMNVATPMNTNEALSEMRRFIFCRDHSLLGKEFFRFCIFWNGLQESMQVDVFDSIMPLLREEYLNLLPEKQDSWGCNFVVPVFYGDLNEGFVLLRAGNSFEKRVKEKEEQCGVSRTPWGGYLMNNQYKLCSPLYEETRMGNIKTKKGVLRMALEFSLIFHGRYEHGSLVLAENAKEKIKDLSASGCYTTPTIKLSFDVQPQEGAPSIYTLVERYKRM